MLIQAKQTISSLLLDNFYPVNIIPTSSRVKESDGLLCTVSVARYGPRASLPAREGLRVIYIYIYIYIWPADGT